MTANRTEAALFPGTFDPFTNGHLDLAARAARLFPRVVVAVARSSTKIPLFSAEERMEMIAETLATLPAETRGRLEVRSFHGLVAGCARDIGARVMIRGLRAVSDFEFEFQMALMNRQLSPDLEIVYLMPDVRYTYLSSGMIKEVARLQGNVTGLVSEPVLRRLLAKFVPGQGA
jgi:pantetheine-phosphate adenylyltransferase